MKKTKIILLIGLAFLLQACPSDLEDVPDFYVSIVNNSSENIYFQAKGIQMDENYPENYLYKWNPKNNGELLILKNDTVKLPQDKSSKFKFTSFLFYKDSTLESIPWETVRDEGLYDARYDLTDEELAELNYTIVFPKN